MPRLAELASEEEGVGVALLARPGDQDEEGLGGTQQALHLDRTFAEPGEQRREGVAATAGERSCFITSS